MGRNVVHSMGAGIGAGRPSAGVIPTESLPGGQGLGNQSPPMVLLLATIALLLGNRLSHRMVSLVPL